MAAAVAPFTCTEARAVLDVYASPGCNDSQLYRGWCFQKGGNDALQNWAVLFQRKDNQQNDFAHSLIVRFAILVRQIGAWLRKK